MTSKTKRKNLQLPKKFYGPLCNKILTEYIEYHKLESDFKLPEIELDPDIAISRIFNIMIRSMSKEKIDEILAYTDEYNMNFPACFRR